MNFDIIERENCPDQLRIENPLLIEGDCLELMLRLPPKSIDLVLCDLPYGETSHIEDQIIPLPVLWERYKRVAKDTCIFVLFSQGLFTATLIKSNEKWYRYTRVWDKVLKTNFLNAKKMPLRNHEDICIFYKKPGVYNPLLVQGKRNNPKGKAVTTANNNYNAFKVVDNSQDSGMKYPGSIIRIQKTHPSIARHRTEKPVPLLEYLIRTYSNEGAVVLDNAAGCGNTILAGELCNRIVIAMEKSREEFLNAKKNLRDNLGQAYITEFKNMI